MNDKEIKKPINPVTFLMIGRSGCGKGTQSRLIYEFFRNHRLGGLLYVYPGRLMRKLSDEDSFTAGLTKELMEKGDRQPSFLSVWSWANEIVGKLKKWNHLVMDGTPRTLMEAKMIDEAMDFYGRTDVRPIFIKTSRAWSKNRLEERGRFDDTEKTIERRLNYFEESVVPVIDYYKKESKHKLITVNGEQSVRGVYAEVLEKAVNI